MEQRIYDGIFFVKFDLKDPCYFQRKKIDINKVILLFCKNTDDFPIELTPPKLQHERYFLFFQQLKFN